MTEPQFKDLKCPECGAAMELVFTNYRYRDGKRKPKYQCIHHPGCKGSHGAHPNGAPLGIPGEAKTKLLRQSLHEIFEIKYPGTIQRVRMKTGLWLLGHGFPAHIGEMNADQCRAAIHMIINKNARSEDEKSDESEL